MTETPLFDYNISFFVVDSPSSPIAKTSLPRSALPKADFPVPGSPNKRKTSPPWFYLILF